MRNIINAPHYQPLTKKFKNNSQKTKPFPNSFRLIRVRHLNHKQLNYEEVKTL